MHTDADILYERLVSCLAEQRHNGDWHGLEITDAEMLELFRKAKSKLDYFK